MWHLYYNKQGDIVILSKKKTQVDLPYLRIDDTVAMSFTSLDQRYIDWQVIKVSGRYKLTKKVNQTVPVWTSRFVKVNQGAQANIVLTKKQNRLVWHANKIQPLTVWITEYNNPLRLYGTLHIPEDLELLVPEKQKISIFTNKKTSICYHDQDLSC
jgi:hypothetical protein